MQFLSEYATWINIALILIVLGVALLRKSKPLRTRFFILALVMIVSALAILVLKSLFDRDRPFLVYPFIEKLSTGGGSSFPSGHTMESFAVATAFAMLFRRRELALPLFLWAAVVGYSRLVLGVHYPSDVLAGMLFGMFIGWVIPYSFTGWLNREKRIESKASPGQ